MSGGLGDGIDTQSSRRHPSEGLDLRQQYRVGLKKDAALVLPKIEEVKKDEDSFEGESNASTILRKTSGWFKRSSKSGDDFRGSTGRSESWRSQSSYSTVQDPYNRPQNPHLDSSLLPESPKKKISTLGRWFKKRNSKPNMSLSGMLGDFRVFARTRLLTTSQLTIPLMIPLVFRNLSWIVIIHTSAILESDKLPLSRIGWPSYSRSNQSQSIYASVLPSVVPVKRLPESSKSGSDTASKISRSTRIATSSLEELLWAIVSVYNRT
jgi:hypothetical protein